MRRLGLVVASSWVFALIALTISSGHAGAIDALSCNGLAPTIFGAGGNIVGTSGNDVIVGTDGDETIDGGSGNDTICGEGGNDAINGGSGNDDMWGEVSRFDPLFGTAGNDDITGGSGNDLLVDTVGQGQTLDAGSGNDRIVGFGDLRGGSGVDNITVAGNNTAGSTLNGGSGIDTCAPRIQADVRISCEVSPVV